VSTGHVHALYRHGESHLHRLAPQVKIVSAFAVVFAIVATPREAIWAFAAYAVLLGAFVALSGIGFRFVASRLIFEVPFLVLAALLPFLAEGPTTEVFGLTLSIEGLWGAWNLAVKATLGMVTAVVLAATTTIPDLLKGLDALRTPRIVTAIMGFMVRYTDVIAGDFSRMRTAMAARAYEPRWVGSLGPYARTFGTVFVRTYERGERVYLSMLARGYRGAMPAAALIRAPAGQWLLVLAITAVFWTIAGVSWSIR
jgi:cobalt/nickel transport system permease protein